MSDENVPLNNSLTGDAASLSSTSGDAASSSSAATASNDASASSSGQQDAGGERVNKAVRSEIGELHANQSYIANEIQIKYEAFVSEGNEIRTFSVDYCSPINPQREQDLNELLVADERVIEILRDSLLAKRFLILAGEPEIGKQMLALRLSSQVRQIVGDPCRDTFVVRPLQRRVKFELRKVVEDKKDFGKRVIIFPQIGESDNRDLLDLFTRLEQMELDGITSALKKSDSFLLFTVDTPHIKPAQEDLKRLAVLHEIQPLSKQLLEQGIEKKLSRFLDDKNAAVEQAIAVHAWMESNKQTLLERLPKMSLLALFIERYLLDIIDGKLDLQAAIDAVASPEKWFLQDLSKDFEAWCFVFTLGLCLCGAETEAVPWLEFETIRREITKCLAQELRMWRHPPEEPSFKKLLDERTLLEKCRAQIVHEAGIGALVRFADGSYPPKLWRVFVNSNRRVLTLILPLLQKLAQSRDPQTRMRAATILGRIGEINPSLITLELIREWSAAKPIWQKAAVGYLYEGILSSPDENYRQICLLKLEHLSLSEDADKLLTAIVTYKQIGQSGGGNLALAVEKLGQITERNFAEWLKWEDKIEKQLEEYLRKKQTSWQELMDTVVNVRDLKDLRAKLRQAYDEDGIMLAICYSLVALSLQVGALAVMVELNKWFQHGHKSLAALTSWIYWMEEGIADRLATYKTTVPKLSKDPMQGCHPMVVSLGMAAQNEPKAISQTADFLAATYNHFSKSFPPSMRQFLRRKFLLHLRNWADSAGLVEEYEQVIKDLYVELLLSQHTDLVNHLTDHLKNDPEFTNKAHLNHFARDVLQSQKIHQTAVQNILSIKLLQDEAT
jgi:hypothetical protein